MKEKIQKCQAERTKGLDDEGICAAEAELTAAEDDEGELTTVENEAELTAGPLSRTDEVEAEPVCCSLTTGADLLSLTSTLGVV